MSNADIAKNLMAINDVEQVEIRENYFLSDYYSRVINVFFKPDINTDEAVKSAGEILDLKLTTPKFNNHQKGEYDLYTSRGLTLDGVEVVLFFDVPKGAPAC